MRRRAHKDLNHDEIVAAFRSLGCYVAELHGVGGGIPDLLIKIQNVWRVVEIKNPAGAYGRKGLSASQLKFSQEAGGAVDVVKTVDDVVALVNQIGAVR